VLDARDDLYELFGAGSRAESTDGTPAAEDVPFDRMLADALAGAGQAELIRGKYPEDDCPGAGRRRNIGAGGVQGELDLHGFHVHEALVRLESFIETAALQGSGALRIIVGRGVHSQAGAVLPDAVEKKIVELKRRGRIATFAWEKKSKRASGSLVVFLP